ncbi:hypothetical protein MHBO_004078 [Bonamia ostreae]|uniref:Uncharacterized protein n=1 Tax=Bonamia ostreae TaxID=126728 RepID=A0ABV2ASB5_9EUKA
MSRETANIVKTRLFCVKHEKKPRIEAFVLPGPGPQSFCPVFLKLKERNGEYKSEEAPVDLTGAQAQEAFPGVLRVVMMDKASGVEPRFVVNDDFCYEGDSNFYSEDYDLYEDYESEGGGDSECEGDQYESFDYREQ